MKFLRAHRSDPRRFGMAIKREPRANPAESAVFFAKRGAGNTRRKAMEAPIQSSASDGQAFCGSGGSTSAVDAEGYATVLAPVFLEDGRYFHTQ